MKRSVLAVLALCLSSSLASAASFNSLVSWGVANGATSYIVQRNTAGGAFATVGTPAVPTFSETGLALNTAYCYQIASVNAVGTSAFSTPVCATTGAPPDGVGAVMFMLTFVP